MAGVSVSCLQWNPNLQQSNLLVVSLSDGSLHLISVKDDVTVVFTKSDIHATSCESRNNLCSVSCVLSKSRCNFVDHYISK